MLAAIVEENEANIKQAKEYVLEMYQTDSLDPQKLEGTADYLDNGLYTYISGVIGFDGTQPGDLEDLQLFCRLCWVRADIVKLLEFISILLQRTSYE